MCRGAVARVIDRVRGERFRRVTFHLAFVVCVSREIIFLIFCAFLFRRPSSSLFIILRPADAMLWLESGLRNGIVPLCCGGASVCFGAYGIQVQIAALQWSVVPTDDANIKRQYKRHALDLQQHAASVAALSIISAAACREAIVDWRQYSSFSSLERIEEWLLRKRPPFFFRLSVLLTATATLVGAAKATGRIRMWQPRRPVIITSTSHSASNI